MYRYSVADYGPVRRGAASACLLECQHNSILLHSSILSRDIIIKSDLVFSPFTVLFVSVQFFDAESAEPPDTLPELIPKRHPSSLLSCPPHLTTSPLHLISLPYSNSSLSFFTSFSIPFLEPYRTFLSYPHLNLLLQTEFPPPPQFLFLSPLHPFTLGERQHDLGQSLLWIFCR